MKKIGCICVHQHVCKYKHPPVLASSCILRSRSCTSPCRYTCKVDVEALPLTASRAPSTSDAWLSSSQKMAVLVRARATGSARLAAKPVGRSRHSSVPVGR